MLEILNRETFAEPGERFKREALAIKESMHIELELEEVEEELKLESLSKNIN